MDLYATNTDGRSRSIYNSTHAGPIATNRNESTSLNREQRTGEKPGGTRDSPLGTGGGEGGRLGGGSQLSEARRGERGAMPSWGMPFYLRCAATARAIPRTPAGWVLARGLAVRSGGAGGSASLPRGGPHGGWFHAGYFDSPDTRIRCVVSNTERRARLAEDRAVRTWLVGNGGARVECARRIQGVRVCLRWNGRWMWLVRSGSKVQVQR